MSMNNLINVDTIRYKRQIFKVTYLDEDGTEISSQEVEEGNNAKAPAGPKKDGSIFTGWSDTATNVQENMTITAMYEPVTYVAAFVDGANGIVSFESYSYGDKLVPPENPTAEGKEFKGWDRILEGRDIVTGHMIVNAVYETNSYTVEFVDDADKVISTQKVEYGKSATPPAALDVTGKEFLGWSTQSEWWYVTENMTVKPILSCLETVDAPSYYAVANETYVAMYLESATEDAKIYYSLNDASPDADDVSADPELQEYDGGPIILEEFEIEEDVDEDKKEVTLHRTAKVNAVATKESMNDSELAELVYNDTIRFKPVYLFTQLFTSFKISVSDNRRECKEESSVF